MKNLNYLSHEVKDEIITVLDNALTDEKNYIEFLVEEHRKALKSMTIKRDYWRDKYNSIKPEQVQPVRTITEPVTVKEFIVKRAVEKPERKNIKVKTTFKQVKESTSGNIKGSKHSGHKTKDEVLVGIFPGGTIIEFDTVNEAKDYIRETYKEFKSSPLTNISRAARKSGFYKDNGGMAYNIIWSYKAKDKLIIE